MLASERQALILSKVRSQGVVRVSDLVSELGVSSMTIRRDLDMLAVRGIVDKFHGGALLRTPGHAETPPAEADRRRDVHVGILVPTGSYYFPSILAGIRRALDESALRRSLVTAPRDPQQERKLIEELVTSHAAGLILTPSIDLERPDPGYASWLLSLPVPVVLVEREVFDRSTGASLSMVRTDHEQGCYQAVTHLARLGHRGVAVVTHGLSQSGTRVVNGWRAAVERAGMAERLSPLITVGKAGYASDASIDAVLDQVRDAQVTALVCHSDELALPLAHRARMRGWSIPDDLSIIAHDDESAEMADPPLTAVSPPKDWIGRTAVGTLLELLDEGTEKPSPVRHVIAGPRLVLRDSTASPRTAKLR